MRIEVLLSTYNGERHLAAQLDSLLAQTHPPSWITVRDDGSRSGTLAVLEQYGQRYPQLRWAPGRNLGPAASFLTLLRSAAPEADAVAFCDQDDVWQPDHLERALTALAAIPSGPALWCSDVLVCDEELEPLHLHDVVRRPPSFQNALVENVATGCTIVLNRAAVDLLAPAQPRHPVMHDAWCYLVVAAFGRVVYDARPSVRYRQHGGNTMGLSSGPVASALARVRRAWRGPHVGAWTRQAEDLRREYGDRLPGPVAEELEAFLADGRFWRRLRYAVAGGACRQRPVGTAAVRLLHVMGRI